MGGDEPGGGGHGQFAVAAEVGEAQGAVIDDEDRECAGYAAGAAGLGLVLQGDEVSFAAVLAQQRRQDSGRLLRGPQVFIHGVDLGSQAGT